MILVGISVIKFGRVSNSIRGLGQIAETLIISLTSVDGLWGKGFEDFSPSLLLNIINNLGVRNYPATITVDYLCSKASRS